MYGAATFTSLVLVFVSMMKRVGTGTYSSLVLQVFVTSFESLHERAERLPALLTLEVNRRLAQDALLVPQPLHAARKLAANLLVVFICHHVLVDDRNSLLRQTALEVPFVQHVALDDGVFRNGVNFTWDSRDSWAQEGGSKARTEEPWPSGRGAAGQHNADYGLVETLGCNLQGCEEAVHLTSFIPSCEQSFAVS